MENLEQEKIIVDCTVAGKVLPLRIEKEKAEAHRQANELLSERYGMYEARNQGKLPVSDILAMTAYSFAVQVVDLKTLWTQYTSPKINLSDLKIPERKIKVSPKTAKAAKEVKTTKTTKKKI